MVHSSSIPLSSWAFPVAAVVFFAVTAALGFGFTRSPAGLVFAAVLLVVLFGTVFAAVHHAEVIAQRIGEPYGTLLLTLSVVIIEVSLITTIMLGDKAVPSLARDTVFAVIMIVCNGLVGLCIVAGCFRHSELEFQVSGANLYLAVISVLATMSLILPNYTLTTPGPVFSGSQLAFVSVVTVVLYVVFLYTQTVRHRDYFIAGDAGDPSHHPPASNRLLAISLALLLASLVAVVILAKTFSQVVDAGADMIGAPPAFAAIVVALLVLMPESIAALSVARNNDLQKSVNLALGSALATIGLTVPAVAVATSVIRKDLVLGLSPRDTILLVITLIVSMLTFGTGRTNIMFGVVHVVLFAIYLFLVFAP